MTAAPLTRVTVVTVAHESATALAGFLAALPPGLGLVLVDNASTDGGAGLARAAGAEVIRSETNRGFGAGCNLGLDAVATEFALLANPDARLSAEAVATLVAAADAFPDAAILAPMIRDGAGGLVRSWDTGQARRRRMQRRPAGEPWPEGPLCAEFLSGACLLLRGSARLRFDEAFFLYFEDDDLCAAARAGGHGLVLLPAAEVLHEGGRSSAPSAAIDRLKARHMGWSRLHFLAKWEGEAEARREGLRQARRLLGKAAGHALTGQRAKLRRDVAALSGTIAWLRGRGHGGPATG
ncbi:glycosyltransferase [Roseomonas sp. PWR1]|uniref:Glycosyltransferase n=1 Tax=Roseomonas nitratireducens TaxID=2820810 RepID=A0ABS4ATU8_9PROT|nr:glycosyltransferase [Neoroseomonas nitratireducens]MBP0464793.1 glycosyltransferase [Neoroseomonas nitratireducens]